MRILEGFWCGIVEPTEYDISSKEYKKLLGLICRNEEKLKTTMTNRENCLRNTPIVCERIKPMQKVME